jgi:hypothetical protein
VSARGTAALCCRAGYTRVARSTGDHEPRRNHLIPGVALPARTVLEVPSQEDDDEDQVEREVWRRQPLGRQVVAMRTKTGMKSGHKI